MAQKEVSTKELTPGQLQIIHLIAEGLTYDEMGNRLGISPRTVKARTDRLRWILQVDKKRYIPEAARKRGII